MLSAFLRSFVVCEAFQILFVGYLDIYDRIHLGCDALHWFDVLLI